MGIWHAQSRERVSIKETVFMTSINTLN